MLSLPDAVSHILELVDGVEAINAAEVKWYEHFKSLGYTMTNTTHSLGNVSDRADGVDVRLYSMDGQLLGTFSSIRAAAASAGVDDRALGRTRFKDNLTAGGYYIRTDDRPFNASASYWNKAVIIAVNVKTGERHEVNNKHELSRLTSVDRTAISRAIAGKTKGPTRTGWTFSIKK